VQPLLLVFENLHWIDTETQAVLDSLIDSIPTARVLLLVNYRPEYQHGWGNKTYYTQLRLDPLPPVSADELLQALLGDDPSLVPLKRHVIARTEGNPFFLEESVRAFVETGGLLGERGDYRLAKPLNSLQVPATVQAVLAARIDRLPPEEKRLLQTAAVIGTEVPFALVQAIVELSDDSLHRAIGYLRTAEFLYETSLFPELAYTFKHALTHEVAYGSLLLERRRALHACIVDASEQLYADRLTEQAEQLAHHAFRGAVWDKAVAYGRQAGTKALARSVLREAVACFEQALAALRYLPESGATQEQAIDLRFDLRNALFALGEFRQMLDYLRQAATIAESLNDQPRLGRVSAYMCRYLREMGDLDGAVESGQHALAIAETLGDVALQVTARHTLGATYHVMGDHHRAMGWLRSNVESLAGNLIREFFGMTALPAVLSRHWLAQCLAELGAFPEGIARGAEAVRIAEEVDHPLSLIYAYLGVGLLSLRQRDLSRAISVLERGLNLCRVYDFLVRFPETASALGYAYACAGRIAEAMPLLEQVEQSGSAMGTVGSHTLWVGYVSEAYLLAGRMQEAAQLAGRALDFARAHKERGHEAWALRLLGEIAIHHAPPEIESATKHYRQALALAEELGMHPLVAHCHLGLGTLQTRTGQQEQARPELSSAIELYRTMEMAFWLPQAEAMLAEVIRSR
jgi:predicted ATPase